MTEVKHKVEYRKIADLEKWADNPRTISKKELEGLMKSLAEDPDYFEGRPILLSDRTGKPVIFAGNQRYEAAKALGWEEVPTVLYHCETEEEEIRRAMRDNHNNGEWDADMLAKFNNYPLDEWLGSDWDALAKEFEIEQEEIIEDRPPEVDEKAEPSSKPGKVYKLGNHRLMCGDSTSGVDMEKLMDGVKADLWLTDPPYNVAIVGGSHAESIEKRLAEGRPTIKNDAFESEENFIEFLADATECAVEHLKDGGAYYIWHAAQREQSFLTALERNGLELRQILVWVKDRMVLGRQDYQWRHEPCLYGWKDGAGHYFTNDRSFTTVIDDRKDIDKMTKGELVTIVKQLMNKGVKTTVLDYERPTTSVEHPTMKPVRMIAEQIRNSTKNGELVLDTFGGSGTTLIAAEQLGRRCNMMELDPRYCDVVRKRWYRFTTGIEDGWEQGTPAV